MPSSSSSLNLYIDHDTSGTIGPSSAGAVSPPSRRRTTGSRRRSAPQKEHLYEVNTAEELKKAVQSETNKLVVVRFHAPYCNACKSIAVAYDRIAKSNPLVKFVDVTIEDRLDYPDYEVPATPYAHIYHPDLGLVEHSPIARRQLPMFKNTLKWWQEGEADLPEEFYSEPEYKWDYSKLSWSNPLGL